MEHASGKEYRGLVLVNTGTGKGKTTASLGAAIRAAGQGLNTIILQFIKASLNYGELQSIQRLDNVEIHSLGLGMVDENGPMDKHAAKAREAWEKARAAVYSDQYELVILDEINVAVHYGFVSVGEVIDLLQSRPRRLHVILTGRFAPREIIEIADTVTEMCEVKHHYRKGVDAVKGIEF
ncbi:MAG: cob(I)yrinic acid a,c-diamide adenosyltransferase [Deltaproteobacteria bacterium]|nr:cob(I)yrinic acid a,c-diamide adenosyltransferase [Deltaproteobacteria bacterium]